MKKNFFILCVVAVIIAMASCQKDELSKASNTLYLENVPYNTNGKAYIDNRYACWENGDQVRLTVISGNSYDGSVSISSPNGVPVATVTAGEGFSHTPGHADIYAAYPKSLFNNKTLGTSTSFKYPASYTYSVSESNNQKIESPMVASVTTVDEKDYLTFVNLCTLLKVEVPAPTNGAFVINEIQVVSDRVNLSGPATVNFSTKEATLPSEGNTISLNFSRSVSLNATKSFYIPIPPISSGTKLTIKINNALNGEVASRVIYANRAIPANSVANVEVSTAEMNQAAYSRYHFYNYITNYKNGAIISGFEPIDLGVTPDNNSEMEITFSPIVTTGSQYYSGARVIGNSADFSISGFTNDSYFVCGFGGGNNAVFSNPMTREAGQKYKHTLKIVSAGSNNYYAAVTFKNITTGAEYTRNTPSISGGISTSAHVYVFGYNSQNRNPGMKLYSYNITINNVLAHNFVPAIDTEEGNKVGVYDMVEERFIPLEVGFEVGND